MELKTERITAKTVMNGKLESSYDTIRSGKKKVKSKKKVKKGIFKSLKKLLNKK
jgi:hypothetical protein